MVVGDTGILLCDGAVRLDDVVGPARAAGVVSGVTGAADPTPERIMAPMPAIVEGLRFLPEQIAMQVATEVD